LQGDPIADGTAEMAAMDQNKDGIATLEEVEIFMREASAPPDAATV